MIEPEEICFNCGQSMITDDDKLYCPIKKRVVDDEETCEEYN